MTQPWIPATPAAITADRWNTPSVDSPPSGMKVWDGSAWRLCPIKYWNGTSWAVARLRYWNGTEWAIATL